MNSITAIIFDLGRVLVNVDTSMFTRDIFTHIRTGNPEAVITEFMADPLTTRFYTGQTSAEQFHAGLVKKYGLDLGFEEFVHIWTDIFSPMDEMEELLKNLNARYTLGMLSDTDPLHWGYIEHHYEYVRIIKHRTLSHEVGCMKPSQQIYKIAAQKVNTPPSQCLYIDDLPQNVEGAREIGMTALQFKGVDQLKKDLKTLAIL